jgi:hypothetical protein
MGPALGFAFGLFIGIALMAVVRGILGPKHAGGNVTALTAVCDSATPGQVNVHCEVSPDPGCTIEGLYAIVYDDPAQKPGPDKEGTEVASGSGPFDFTMMCSSVNKDRLAVWPIFKGNGPPADLEIGPCTTSSSSSTSSSTSSTTSSTTSSSTTMFPARPPGASA